MSILNRKRRIKCSVQFTIQELLSVPFINGILFCKLRLVEGGSFTAYSSKKEILHSSVVWNFDINFEVKINSNILNNDLYEPCICRISVRKEIRGGKSYQKLGYIDYNLSDYINKNETINRVLKEYDSKNRLDNSFLKVKIKVKETQQSSIQLPPRYKKLSSPIHDFIDNQKGTQKILQNNQITSSSISSSSSSSSPLTSSIQQQQQQKQDDYNLIINNNNNNDNNNDYNNLVINNVNIETIKNGNMYISHTRNSSKSSAMSIEKGHQSPSIPKFCQKLLTRYNINMSNGSTTSNNSYETTTTRSKNKKLIEELQSKEANIRIIETRIDAHEIINQVENELVNRTNIDLINDKHHQHHSQHQNGLNYKIY